MKHNADDGSQKHDRSRTNIVLVAFLAIAGFYLIAEHRAHLLGWLPFLIILACPLLHIFMHSKHGGHSDHSGESSTPRTKHSSHDH